MYQNLRGPLKRKPGFSKTADHKKGGHLLQVFGGLAGVSLTHAGCWLHTHRLRQQQQGAVQVSSLKSTLHDPSYENSHNVQVVTKWEQWYNRDMVENI